MRMKEKDAKLLEIKRQKELSTLRIGRKKTICT